MKIIVGLGNLGDKYKTTRHNAGFLAVDNIVTSYKLQVTSWEQKFHSLILNYSSENSDRVTFAKPQTFMNDSGAAIKEICDFYKVDVGKDLLVIHDDSDLPLGTTRLADASSSAGHKGVQSVIDALGTQEFHRIRIGVETRKSKNDLPTDAFVLQQFTNDELEKLKNDVFPRVKVAVGRFINSE